MGSPGIDVSNNFSVHPRLSDDFYGPLDGVPRDVMATCFTRQILSLNSQNSFWRRAQLKLGSIVQFEVVGLHPWNTV